MARTEQEIYDLIIADKNDEVDLTNLNSPSNTALWRLWAWITAKAHHIHEQLFDSFKAEVNTLAAAAIPGTLPWYRAKALEFQYGYSLTFVDNKPVYTIYDADARIIARVAIVELAGELQFKVSKNVSGYLEPLSAGEQAAFEAYLNQVKFAGTKTSVISLNRDLLRLYPDATYGGLGGNFYYDASYSLAAVQADMDAKINSYLQSLEYNGYLYTKRLENVLKEVLGYDDMELSPWQATTAAAVDYEDVGRRYQPLAGHILLESGALSNELNFIPVTNVQS